MSIKKNIVNVLIIIFTFILIVFACYASIKIQKQIIKEAIIEANEVKK